MLPYLDEHPNVVVLRTFSKSYSLAGARLGLLFAAAPLVAEMMKVKDSYNVNAVTQALGTAALEDRKAHEDAMRGTLDERARLERELGALGLTWPGVARQLPARRDSASAPRPSTARSRTAGLLVRWWSVARAAHEAADHRGPARPEQPAARGAEEAVLAPEASR